jgi:hypothetical protein
LAANGPAIDTGSSFVPQECSRAVMDVEISRYFQDDHRVLETILHGPVGGILMMIATRASAKIYHQKFNSPRKYFWI